VPDSSAGPAALDASSGATPTPDAALDGALVERALCSRDGEAPWTVVWGRLPAGAESLAGVTVVFRNGRRTQPAARMGVLGRHWAAEVAGRFDRVVVDFAGTRTSTKVKPWEPEAKPRRRGRRGGAPEPADPLEQMKQRWGLAALILQPSSVDLPELPDLRIVGG
jgi:hypothetical protein